MRIFYGSSSIFLSVPSFKGDTITMCAVIYIFAGHDGNIDQEQTYDDTCDDRFLRVITTFDVHGLQHTFTNMLCEYIYFFEASK